MLNSPNRSPINPSSPAITRPQGGFFRALLKHPTQAELVKLRLRAIRREMGTAQAQARPLRFKGPVRDIVRDTPRGLNVRGLLEACGDDLPGLRDRALLSVAYDSGLRASELTAVAVEHIIEALDPEARLLEIPRSKGDQDGEGATAFLSPRSVRAIAAWMDAADISVGPLFRHGAAPAAGVIAILLSIALSARYST